MFSRSFRVSCCLGLSVFMSDIPSMAFAQHAMIPTSSVVRELERAQSQASASSARADLQNLLNRDDVRKALEEKGLSRDEISARLASLSEREVRELSTQVQQARAGGDILIAILIVVLIIFLIKRM